MRDYSKIGPQFWIGKTGKKLRAAGEKAQIVGMYLLTSPHSNMLGLYYQPLLYIAHETGLGIEGALEGLLRCVEAGFCAYDDVSECVWVYEMAKYQIGESLKPNDKRVLGVQYEYEGLPENKHLGHFYDKYAEIFCMKDRREILLESSPLEAPSKDHQCQAQEQAQAQEHAQAQEQAQEQAHLTAAEPPPPEKRTRRSADTTEVWLAYAIAYENRHGTAPLRNAKINAQLAQLLERIPKHEAPQVAAYFVRHNERYYVQKMHPIGLLLADAEKLRTEWFNGTQMTAAQAAQIDRTQTNFNAFAPLIAEAKAREAQQAEGRNHVE